MNRCQARYGTYWREKVSRVSMKAAIAQDSTTIEELLIPEQAKPLLDIAMINKMIKSIPNVILNMY